jgi:alkylmercury lyase
MSEVLRDDVCGAAFRRLLRSGAPATAAELAGDLALPAAVLEGRVAALAAAGRLRVDDAGRVVGAVGLSVAPDRHEIELGGRRLWTWCAYDVVGIFGALGASGAARSSSPLTGAALEVAFRDGRPEPTGVVLFRPQVEEMGRCASVYEEWCPNSNFFESAEAARQWARARGVSGAVHDLARATAMGAREWGTLLPTD